MVQLAVRHYVGEALHGSKAMYFKLIFLIGVWWLCNIIFTLSTKKLFLKKTDANIEWKPCNQWLVLTCLQSGIGGFFTLLYANNVLQKNIPLQARRSMTAASVANFIGQCTTNYAFFALTSSSVQIIKSMEPVFTFLLTVIVSKTEAQANIFTAMIIICYGSTMYLDHDSGLNVYGFAAALASNLSFSLRNIILKMNNKKTAMEKYAIISTWTFVYCVPLLIIEIAVNQRNIEFDSLSLAATFSHVMYNVASLNVLQCVSPIVHSVLNLLKRAVVVTVNIFYFSITFSNKMKIGVALMFIGLVLFVYFNHKNQEEKQKEKCKNKKKYLVLIAIAFVCVVSGTYYSRTKAIKMSKSTNLFTSWIYDRDIPIQFVRRIEKFASKNKRFKVNVYCGSTRCMKSFKITDDTIQLHFLRLFDIIQDTPFNDWMKRLPIIKLLSGKNFEDLLKHVVRLSLLYKYGGVYMDPSLEFIDFNFPIVDDEAWVVTNDVLTFLDICYFPKQSNFILMLSISFTKEHPSRYINEKWPVEFNHDEHTILTYHRYINRNATVMCGHTRITEIYTNQVSKKTTASSRSNHYSTLSFYERGKIDGVNIGDEIQGYTGMQFLPYLDTFVDRQNLSLLWEYKQADAKTTLFMNAWWGNGALKWPPSLLIEPQFISMHLQPAVWSVMLKHISYLKQHEPIGARDTPSLNWFREHEVESYLSGCLTLLLKNRYKKTQRTDEIYVVDVKPKYISLIPEEIEYKIIRHHFYKDSFNSIKLFSAAYERIDMYSRAKLVITQRIHAAVPCVALGTPVIFINSPKMPGAGGSLKIPSSRTAGLTGMFHTLNMYQINTGHVKKFFENFNYENPPENPGFGLMMKFRATQWNVLRNNPTFYDSAKKFDLIPTTIVNQSAPYNTDIHLVYHPSNERKSKNQVINKYNLRGIESILHHHPSSKLRIYSNELIGTQLEVLSEVGYDIQLVSYNINKMIEISNIAVLQDFKTLPIFSKCHHIPLIKLLILYNNGGVLIEQSTIILRSLMLIHQNLIGCIESSAVSFMKFEARHESIRKIIELYTQTYTNDQKCVETIDCSLLRSIDIRLNNMNTQIITDLSDHQMSQCNIKNATIKINSHGVKISPKYLEKELVTGKTTPDSPCHHFLNTFCVLCNILY